MRSLVFDDLACYAYAESTSTWTTDMPTVLTAVYFFAALALTSMAIAALLPWLRRRSILDMPNERANHVVPTPRGGGAGIVVVLLFLLGLDATFGPSSGNVNGLSPLVLCGALFALALVCAWDDIKSMPVALRFCAQIAVIAFCVSQLPAGQHVLSDAIPLGLDRALVAVCWLWFVNLYNFMDGIDGITGAETASIASGVLLVNAVAYHESSVLAVVLVGCALGFLIFNWHPARIFLGDVGSVPIGFLIGALLIELAMKGALASALILPAYYLVDSGLTLVERGLRREKIWRAHSQHAYQRAVRRGLPHDRVTLLIVAYNILAVGLAVAATASPWAATVVAFAAAIALYGALRRGSLDGLLRLGTPI